MTSLNQKEVKNTVILDLFLGDSGKGKISDFLAENYNSVIRFNGANNAGHTIQINNIQYKTHAVPSGVLYSHTTNFISHGCAIDPYVLVEEIKQFKSLNPNIFISGQAHVILPYHIAMDIEREIEFGIGSTKRGVAPAYESKASRMGMRYQDFLLDRDVFIKKYQLLPMIKAAYDIILKVYDDLSSFLKDHIILDGVSFVHNLVDKGPALFEGAQGTFLDIDLGSYPYVTSSNCTIGAVLTGTGLNMNDIQEVIGVIKSYGSYVGTNPDFNDIKEEDLNNQLCSLGNEYGATTGRRRRLCWLDLDKIKKAVRINGPTKLAMTRMDTLGQMPKVFLKSDEKLLEFEPWGDISSVKQSSDLPDKAREYINFVEKTLEVPIWAIGNGPKREDLIFF